MRNERQQRERRIHSHTDAYKQSEQCHGDAASAAGSPAARSVADNDDDDEDDEDDDDDDDSVTMSMALESAADEDDDDDDDEEDFDSDWSQCQKREQHACIIGIQNKIVSLFSANQRYSTEISLLIIKQQ